MSRLVAPPLTDDAPGAEGLALHVLDGPNLGAEIRLHDGVWVIGTGPAADLTFADPDLADAHLRLIVRDGAVSLETLAEGVRLDGAPLATGMRETLPLLRAVQVGRTAFAVGPIDAYWKDVVAPSEAPRPEPETTPEQPPPTRASPEEQRRPISPSPFRSRWYFWSGLLAGFIVLAVIGALWAFDVTPRPARPPPAAAPDPLETAQAIIDEQGLKSSVSAVRASGVIVISGLVPTSAEQTALSSALQQARLAASVNVVSEASMRELIATVLSGYGIAASITITPEGTLRVDGYAPSEAARAAGVQRLPQDIPWIRKIEDGIVTPEGAAAELQTTLHDLGMDSLSVSYAPHTVTVSGVIPAAREQAWNAAVKAFAERNGQLVTLVPHISPLGPLAPTGVTLGPHPYLMMDDGKHLGVGENLGSLGQIVMIYADKIRVRTAQGDLDVRYARPPYWIVEDEHGSARQQ